MTFFIFTLLGLVLVAWLLYIVYIVRIALSVRDEE